MLHDSVLKVSAWRETATSCSLDGPHPLQPASFDVAGLRRLEMSGVPPWLASALAPALDSRGACAPRLPSQPQPIGTEPGAHVLAESPQQHPRQPQQHTTEEGEEIAAGVCTQDSKIILGDVLVAMQSLPFPWNASRSNVFPHSQDGVRGVLLAMCSHAGSDASTRWTRQYPHTSRLFARRIAPHNPHFAFASIQVKSQYAARPHIGRHNVGPSYILALGDCGRLWAESADGRGERILQEHVPGYCVGRWAQTQCHMVRCRRAHAERRHGGSFHRAWVSSQLRARSSHSKQQHPQFWPLLSRLFSFNAALAVPQVA